MEDLEKITTHLAQFTRHLGRGSNTWPQEYETAALSSQLTKRVRVGYIVKQFSILHTKMVIN